MMHQGLVCTAFTVLLLLGSGTAAGYGTGGAAASGDSVTHVPVPRTPGDKFKAAPSFGVIFTQETGLMGMGGFSGTYRTDGSGSTEPSRLSVSLAVSTRLFLMTGIQGVWHAPTSGARFRNLMIRYDAFARYMPERFYGTGYGSGQAGEYVNFKNITFSIRSDYLFSFGKFLIGPVLGFDMMRADDFPEAFQAEEYAGTYTSILTGLLMELDTRDMKTSPTRGVFLSIDNTVSPASGGPTGFHSIVTADFFVPLWRGGCLAFDVYGDFSSAGSHWLKWGRFGGDSRMRGYYTGRYRDRNHICIQTELRHWFTGVHGAAAWCGAGTIFPDFSSLDLNRLLPTFGAGYRLNIAGTLLRIDAGFGSGGQWSLSAGVNQAF